MCATVTSEAKNGAVLVTGAARRIGREIALDLSAHGWAVAIHCHAPLDDAESLCREIETSGGTATVVQADLSREDEADTLVAKASAAVGPLRCLINNASVFEYDTPLTATRKSWDRHMEVNLRAPFVLIQRFVEQLPEAAEGNVINIIDQRVWNPTPQFTSYTLSKAGLWALTKTLAQGLAPRVRVNAIGPGPTLRNEHQSDAAFEREWSSVLLGRKVDTAEICDAVRFILHARSMTGQMIALDSGQHLRWSVMTSEPGAPDDESSADGAGS